MTNILSKYLGKYDDQDYIFLHTSPTKNDGELLQGILNIPINEVEKVRYFIKFLSGASGQVNRVVISLPISDSNFKDFITTHKLISIISDEYPSDSRFEIQWLVDEESDGSEDLKTNDELVDLCGAFLRSRDDHHILESFDSKDIVYSYPGFSVNSWVIVYYSNGFLNYISFEQG